MEIWKDVKDYEGIYKISNLGDVKSVKRLVDYGKIKAVRRERILSSRVGKYGYVYVTLAKCKVNTTKKIHRLVAENFILNPENKPQVNHKDGNKNNNCVDNLEWMTARDNINHAYSNGLKTGVRGKKSHLSKLNENQIKEIRTEYSKGILSQKKIGIKFNISQAQVYRIVNNINWVVK